MFNKSSLLAVLACALFFPTNAEASKFLFPGGDEPALEQAEGGSSVYYYSDNEQAGPRLDADVDFGPNFPLPASLRPNVEFWVAVYSKYTTKQWIIHDKENLGIVYDVVSAEDAFPGLDPDSSAARKHILKRQKRIEEILKNLYSNKGVASNQEEARIANALPIRLTSKSMYRELADGVRSQRGQADRFVEGLRRSGAYLDRMKRIFRQNGMPEELTALPHVESSFNYQAYSKVGAAGIWQFTRGTGRRFLRIDYTVDERLDPMISTYAAARLLKINYDTLGSWPLALIAYNHGLNGMSRAVSKHGADLVEIIDSYQSKMFGFASKNFYAEFLAALEVSRNSGKYFGPVQVFPEARYDEITIEKEMPASALVKATGISSEALRPLNQALTGVVWGGRRYIPKGYQLKVPEGMGAAVMASLQNTDVKFAQEEKEVVHLVRRGENAWSIARQYGIGVRTLLDANAVTARSVRRGMRLIVPVSAKSRGPAVKSGEPGYYIAETGDTLASISQNIGVSGETLARINGLGADAEVVPGQKLVVREDLSIIPAAAEKSSPTPPVGEPSTAPQAPRKILVAMDYPQNTSGASQSSAVVPSVEDSRKDSATPTAQVDEQDRALRLDPAMFTLVSASGDEGILKAASEENLALYAEWAGVGLSQIRKMNKGMRKLAFGSKVLIPLDKITPAEFERKRLAYHTSMLERFLAAHEVRDEKRIIVQPGYSVWRLCVKDHKTPMWLAQLYNPEKEISRLAPGDTLVLPDFIKR